MRLRLMPVLIITASIALTARVGDLWQGFGSLAQAQTATPAETKAAKATVPRTARPREKPRLEIDRATCLVMVVLSDRWIRYLQPSPSRAAPLELAGRKRSWPAAR